MSSVKNEKTAKGPTEDQTTPKVMGLMLMNNFAEQYVIDLKGGEVVRLKKGMTKQEVISILGAPLKIESCKNKSNEKWIFKIATYHVINASYTLLFTREALVYAAKLK